MPFPLSDKAQQVIAQNEAMIAEFANLNPATLGGYITVVAELNPLTGALEITANSGGNLAVRRAMMDALDDHEPLNPNTNVVTKFDVDKEF